MLLLLILAPFRQSVAQWILYAPQNGRTGQSTFTPLGKAGDHYWILREERRFKKTPSPAFPFGASRYLEIYDSRLRFWQSIPDQASDSGFIKEYFVAGPVFMDRISLGSTGNTTRIIRKRYRAQGGLHHDSLIATLPFSEPGHRFLLLRSEDKRKILLLGFESVTDSSPVVHALLFNQDWLLLRHNTHRHPSLTQPVIQDELTGLPAEHFSNTPVKLMNSGEWITVVPSRTGLQFELFHFRGQDSAFVNRTFRKTPQTTLEEVSLVVHNTLQEASAGVLSRYTYRSLKQVQVVQYALAEQTIRLDTAYRFNALWAAKILQPNLVKESLTPVPGSGFLLLREYGRTFGTWYDGGELPAADVTELIRSNEIALNENALNLRNRSAYTRSGKLGGMRSQFNRGDLSLFYFPARREESCWSGLIQKEQFTEFNSPYLSYLCIPVPQQLVFLYNNFYTPRDQYGSAIVLDRKGYLLPDEGMVFWKYQYTLLFQQAQQITDKEIAVPYQYQNATGFAIIRF